MTAKTMLTKAAAVAAVLTSCGLAGCGAGAGAPGMQSGAQTKNSASPAELEQANALQVQADGTVTIKPKEAWTQPVSPEAEAMGRASVGELNKLVAAGTVRVAQDLSVKPSGSGAETRSPSYCGWHWWGVTFYFPHADIVSMSRGAIYKLAASGLTRTLLVTGPIAGALYYVDNTCGHRGAYLNVTWVMAWWGSPSA